VHDLFVVSDLHIGRGKNSQTGRHYELETFFYDEDFRRFCEYICKQAAEREVPLKLVFNGDTFDLLRLDPVPLPEEFENHPGSYNPVMTPARAAAEMTRVFEGHPQFLEALVIVLSAGNEIVMLPGNHDIEVQWEPVRDAIRDAIRTAPRLAGDPARADDALSRLHFHSWFYHEPGRAWIEHGCQYDPENAFRYPLRGGLVDEEDALHQAELDNPLGNFFQRYLYNAFGHITFIVPSTRANTRYVKWLVFNHPQLLARVITSHWRFWWHVLRRVAKYPSRQRDRLQRAHEDELEQLARSSSLGDKLRKIDSFKETRADVTATLQSLGRQAVKLGFSILMIGLLVLGLWFAMFHGLNQLQLGLMGKATVFLTLGFVFLFSAFGAVLFMLTRSNAGVPPQPLREAAAKIGTLVDVPIVTFGHTHDEVLFRHPRPEGSDSWYYNTGTWIAVFTHDVLLPRERIQFTFLRIRGHSAELLHWSPGRGEPMPVILLDEPRESTFSPSPSPGSSMIAGVVGTAHGRTGD
jgi:UDP-2,3-diacylglucosamine pyrophosphatase LpxH